MLECAATLSLLVMTMLLLVVHSFTATFSTFIPISSMLISISMMLLLVSTLLIANSLALIPVSMLLLVAFGLDIAILSALLSISKGTFATSGLTVSDFLFTEPHLSKTTRPPTMVLRIFASRIVSGGMLVKSRSMSVRSANLPRAMVPFSASMYSA